MRPANPVVSNGRHRSAASREMSIRLEGPIPYGARWEAAAAQSVLWAMILLELPARLEAHVSAKRTGLMGRLEWGRP